MSKHILNICDIMHDCCIHQCYIILLELYWYICVEGSLLILLGYLLYKILHSWVLQDNDLRFQMRINVYFLIYSATNNWITHLKEKMTKKLIESNKK